MLIQSQVAPVAGAQSISPGTLAPLRAGNLGDTIVSELHGRYYETTYRRASFVANVALQTTSVGTTAIYTGLAITNPLGSTVNLVLNKVGIAFGAVTAAGYVGLMGGFNGSSAVTQTTPQTARNKYLGGASGVGLAASSITAPGVFTAIEVLGSMGSLATTGDIILPGYFDVEGSWIVPPGGVVAIFTSVVTTNALVASIAWEEVPV